MEKWKAILDKIIAILQAIRDWLDTIGPAKRFFVRCAGYGTAGFTAQWWGPWLWALVIGLF